MNRSFRAAAPKTDKDDDLALFQEMRTRDKDRNSRLLLDHGSPLSKTVTATMPLRRTAAEELLNSDNDKNDYDWLITPPGTPLFPSLDNDYGYRSPPMGHAGTPKACKNILKSRLVNSADSSSRNSLTSRQVTSSPSLSSAAAGNRRLSSSGGLRPSSRPPTPTGRGISSATSKPSRPSTPTSRTTIPTKPLAPPPRTTGPARSSTFPSIRSSVPTSTRSFVPASTRPSTPTSRPSLSAPNKPISRPATPTRRSSAPSMLPGSSAPSIRSSPVTKAGAAISRSSTPSRGSSPTVRSRPWNPSDMPGFSLDAPPNLRTSLPDRPSSACRGRPGAPSRSSSVVPEPIARPRRQSCSPSRGRTPNGVGYSGSSVPAIRRSHLNSGTGDTVSPGQIGSKMVERVVNARRLVPPKQDDRRSISNGVTGKSSTSPDSIGFGRNMSKKSLDMALRHMDIRRSIPNNLRPLMMNIPPSVHSVRSGSTRSRSVSVSGSPMATSSTASSEQSFSNNYICLDGSEAEDDICSYRGGNYSPAGPLPR